MGNNGSVGGVGGEEEIRLAVFGAVQAAGEALI